jgi:Secretion system C-terminal sorting domain/PKD domain
MKVFFTTIAVLNCFLSLAQQNTKRVLFLGNSYTYYNNLPQMLSDIASSTGDNIIFDSNTPGGHTLQEHSNNTLSQNKIGVGNWDYVVLQEQSQLPSLPISEVNTNVFPYARKLDSIINLKNACAETIFYMTWGRKNGDGSNCSIWPPVCTYLGMDSLLSIRYKTMANNNNALVSPVGAVWKKLRQSFPQIELYQTDESHPVEAGSYAAACCFYTIIFKKNPLFVNFNSTLSATDAANIRSVVKQIVYDSLLNWNVGKYDPKANFTYSLIGTNEFKFTNTSLNTDTYSWDFGDGVTSNLGNPVHQFLNSGSFSIKLISSKCGKKDTTYQTISIIAPNTQIPDSTEIKIFPNPAKNTININGNIISNLNYSIFNAEGENIMTGILNIATKQINVSPLGDGVYFLRLFNGSQFLSLKKFIKIAN